LKLNIIYKYTYTYTYFIDVQVPETTGYIKEARVHLGSYDVLRMWHNAGIGIHIKLYI